MSLDGQTIAQFKRLFSGFETAYGTGRGGWVHRPVTTDQFVAHLNGRGEGLGIAPLRPDDTCSFAAIDLDKPDFELARTMMTLLPGVSWLERSRSGNAHVLVFFDAPIEAWIVRGIMREALAAVGERAVEIFPKTDHLLPGMVGNYLNLPYFGDTRPVIASRMRLLTEWGTVDYNNLSVTSFVRLADEKRNSPEDWRKRAQWLGVPSPADRAQGEHREFGTAPTLHICGQHLLENRDTNPVREGHRAVVFFSLAKMLANWSEVDHDEALGMMALVNDASPDPIEGEELRRILFNAERGEFTSTGCDDPLFEPYRHPKCKIGSR